MKPIQARPAHMYNLLALHAQGRSAMPLPLSAGKQQTRELTPSKIITNNSKHRYYQRREVDGLRGRMEQSTRCQWDTLSNHNQNIGTIQHYMPMGHHSIQLNKYTTQYINGTIQQYMPMGHNSI